MKDAKDDIASKYTKGASTKRLFIPQEINKGEYNSNEEKPLTERKYKSVFEDNPFYKDILVSKKDVEKPRERNKVKISPYQLMCKWCLSKRTKYAGRIEVISICEELIEKHTNIEYMIRKNFEVIFLKKLLLGENEKTFFRYNFKSINLMRPDTSQKFLEELDHEFNYKITKEIIERADESGRDDLLDEFAHYHTN